MKDLISVIIPVYNVERYIEKCVNSVLKQTYTNLEIILIDDGSIDNSGKICDELAKTDNRIIVIHKENGGVSSARNIGIKRASGKYIGFVDSDDYINIDMFEKLYNLYKQDNIQLSTCGICGLAKQTTRTYNRRDFLEDMLGTNGSQGFLWNKLYCKQIIDEYNICLDGTVHVCEDLLFNINYVSHIEFIAKTSEELYHYELIPTSVTNCLVATKRWVTLIDAYLKMQDEYKKYDCELYNLFIHDLLWAATRVKIEMVVSNVNYDGYNDKCNKVIKNSINKFIKAKNISFIIKLKILTHIYFYKQIAWLKKVKRKIKNRGK